MNNGYTLVELLLTMGVLTILLSMGVMGFAAMKNQSTADYYATQLKSEILRAQRETANGKQSGVYVSSGEFVFFYGSLYVPNEPTNEIISLPSSLTIAAVTFDQNTILFDAVTGFPENYADPYQVVIQSVGATRTVVVNVWGVIEIR